MPNECSTLISYGCCSSLSAKRVLRRPRHPPVLFTPCSELPSCPGHGELGAFGFFILSLRFLLPRSGVDGIYLVWRLADQVPAKDIGSILQVAQSRCSVCTAIHNSQKVRHPLIKEPWELSRREGAATDAASSMASRGEGAGYKAQALHGALCLNPWMKQNCPDSGTQLSGDLGLVGIGHLGRSLETPGHGSVCIFFFFF